MRLFDSTASDSSPYLAAFTGAGLMGLMGVFVRQVSVSGETIVLARFSLGFLFLICSLAHGRRFHGLPHHFSIHTVLSGIFLAFCALFYVKAIQLTTLANAAFLLYLGPMVAVVTASVLLGEKMTWINGLLILSALAGCGLLIGIDVNLSVGASLGNLYAALSAMLYALFIVVNRMIPSEISPTTRSLHQLLVAALVLIPFSGIDSETLTNIHSDLWWLVAIGFFQGFLSVYLMVFAIEHLKTFQYSTIAYVEPIVAAVAGMILHDEAMTLRQGIGGVVILTSGIAQTCLSIKLGGKPRKSGATRR